MKKRAAALILSAIVCMGLMNTAYASTTLVSRDGHTRLEYHDPNPLPPAPGSTAEEPVSPFPDVQPGDYYYDAVLWAVEQGIAGSSGQSEFGPNEDCTRAETMTILWRAYGSPAPESGKSPFDDVRPGDYYHDAVLWAVEQGITNGGTPTAFNPGQIVTRGQIITFLYRAAKARDVGGVDPFIDVPEKAYYAAPVRWAVSRGIAEGTGVGGQKTFSPDQTCTRGHIVTFLYRANGG